MNTALRDLLTRILDKNPESRINMTDLMSHDWVTNNGILPSVLVRDSPPSSQSVSLGELISPFTIQTL